MMHHAASACKSDDARDDASLEASKVRVSGSFSSFLITNIS
jgi:hypothetical protein